METVSGLDVYKRQLLGCSSFPARKILNSLLTQNKITVTGNARATRYHLSNKPNG